MSYYRDIFLALSTLLLCVWFSMVPGSAIAQLQYDPELGEARMSGVVEVEGVSKDELHRRAKLWLAQNFKSADGNVLQDEGASGTLVSTNNLLLPNKSKVLIIVKDRIINHKLTVDVKDGRYRYMINNVVYSFVHWDPSKNTSTSFNIAMNDSYQRLHEKAVKRSGKGKEEKDKHKDFVEVDEALTELMESLERSMRGTSTESSDDW